MMNPEDYLLSIEQMRAKYADKGSPNYPTHVKGCQCSGCYASWTEWRCGYAAVRIERARVVSWLHKVASFAESLSSLEPHETGLDGHELARRIERGEHV
jgi:hypothetical protein